jgi:hypothetical protein
LFEVEAGFVRGLEVILVKAVADSLKAEKGVDGFAA